MAQPTRQRRNEPASQQEGEAVQAFSHPGMSATEAAVECFKEYARERPEIVTMWAFGLGFIFGWKLRIW